MEQLRTYLINPILNVFRFHKFKIFFVFFLTLVFYVLFFPYYQLSGLIEAQISKSSRGQTQVSFSDLSLSVIPFGISAENVSIYTPQMPSALSIKKAYIKPSIGALLRFKKGGVLTAEQIFGGDLILNFSDLGQGTSKNKQSEMVNIQAQFSNIDLNKFANWYKAPFSTAGSLSGSFDIKLDNKAFEQPLGNFQFQGKNVKLPSSVKLMGMDLLLPEGGLKKMDLKGRLSNGQLNIPESTFGTATDVIYGKVKGSMGLNFMSSGGRLTPRPSEYDFSLDLNLDKTTEQKIGSLLSMVLSDAKGGKSPTVDGGSRYLLGLKGFPNSPPNIEPISPF